MTTTSAVTLPASVVTSTLCRPGRMRATGDRSKTCAPSLTAAAIRPMPGAIGIESGRVRLDGARPPRFPRHGARLQPQSSGPRAPRRGARRTRGAAPSCRTLERRWSADPARARVAADAEAPERRRKLQRRPPAGLPHVRAARSPWSDACAANAPSASSRISPAPPAVAPGADAVRFEQDNRHAGGSQAPRGRRTGESAADDDDPGVEMSAKTRKRGRRRAERRSSQNGSCRSFMRRIRRTGRAGTVSHHWPRLFYRSGSVR